MRATSHRYQRSGTDFRPRRGEKIEKDDFSC
jgi:hypothetical protein